jgi:flavin reductase ActVB
MGEDASVSTVPAPGSIGESLREALAWYPSGVAVVTTADADGTWWGFTASSFCSLSADPPLVLVCLAQSAQCYPAFLVAEHWAVHGLGHDQDDLARAFATHGRTKFARWAFELSPSGNPVLADSGLVLECRNERRHEGGDHTILIGRVESVHHVRRPPAIYFRRAFHRIHAAEDHPPDGPRAGGVRARGASR